MSRINLDNLKTFHEYDQSDNYDYLLKFSRFFEKGYKESQINQLPIDPNKITSLIVCTDGHGRYLADFLPSITPFFISTPLEICTSYRLPTYANDSSLCLLLFQDHNTEEAKSIQNEIDSKSIPYLSAISLENRQNIPYILGFMFGFFCRLNPSFTKTINTDNLFLSLEKNISKNTREIQTTQNPSKILAAKHSQKAIFFLSSGHLYGSACLGFGLVTRWAKTLSFSLSLPEANHYLSDLLTFPSKVLAEYQFIILDSDLYSQATKKQIEAARKTLSDRRISYTLIKADTQDWFEQIYESVVFLSFFSYYLSITNKVKN